MPGKLKHLVPMGIPVAKEQPGVQQLAILQLQLRSSANDARCKERQRDVMPESSNKGVFTHPEPAFCFGAAFCETEDQSHQAVWSTVYQGLTAVTFKPTIFDEATEFLELF